MRSVRSLILIGTIVALAALAPVASASIAKPFHVVKVCANLSCVITSSSYKRIPAGTVINYTVNTDGSLTSVITVAHGTATGRCVLAPIFGNPSSPGSLRLRVRDGLDEPIPPERRGRHRGLRHVDVGRDLLVRHRQLTLVCPTRPAGRRLGAIGADHLPVRAHPLS